MTTVASAGYRWPLGPWGIYAHSLLDVEFEVDIPILDVPAYPRFEAGPRSCSFLSSSPSPPPPSLPPPSRSRN
eukprot:7342960-Pyramimonas_sp.AAC.1